MDEEEESIQDHVTMADYNACFRDLERLKNISLINRLRSVISTELNSTEINFLSQIYQNMEHLAEPTNSTQSYGRN